MAAVSLSTLRTLARERADMVGSTFIADSATGIDRWINEGAQKLHQILVETYEGDYAEKQYAAVVSSGLLSLPADFFKLLGVEMTVGGLVYTLKRFNRQERNAYRNANVYSSLPLYKLTGPNGANTKQLEFLPAAAANGQTITIRYAPVFTARNLMGADTGTVLTATTDTVDFENGWERYVVLYTAIQMLKKEESDARDLEKELEMCRQEIVTGAEHRDADMPPSAVDADMVDFDPLRFI
jgi:hypothetical protein